MSGILKLNLGSAYRKMEGFINIDFRPETEPDLCFDVCQGLPYADNSVDEVRAFDFLEHIPADKTIFVMEEIHRVLKPGGKFESLTPSTDGRGAFQDPTHCLDPSTRVLTSDLQWVCLDMVRTGDELFGIDEFPADGRGAKRRLLPAIVEAVRYVTAPAYRLIFEDGREVIASADHRFIGRAKRGGSNTAWRAVHEFRRGDVLRRVVDPWGPPGYEEGWVGGLIDGEASLRTRTAGDGTNVRAGYGGGGHALNITQKPGAVYDRAVAYLTTHAYHFSEGLQCQREAWRQKPSTVGRINVHRADEIIRLLGQTRPSRLPKDWWHGCRLSGTNQDGWARLVSSETVGERSLIDLQTSTRTFVAEGLATHNCSFWNRNSWFYYSEPEYRKLYGIKADFEIISSEEKRVDRWKIIQDHVVAIKR